MERLYKGIYCEVLLQQQEQTFLTSLSLYPPLYHNLDVDSKP